MCNSFNDPLSSGLDMQPVSVKLVYSLHFDQYYWFLKLRYMWIAGQWEAYHAKWNKKKFANEKLKDSFKKQMPSTFFYLCAREFLAGPRSALHDVGEADAEAQQLTVVVRVHGAWDQARQEHTFPCNKRIVNHMS